MDDIITLNEVKKMLINSRIKNEEQDYNLRLYIIKVLKIELSN